MAVLARDSDTICAVATAPGVGGIAVIRVSGEKALTISRSVCQFLPSPSESHRVYYGFACDIQTQERIDEVLVSYFVKGRSFTGEDTIEISCHGSPMIAAELCQQLIKAGARAAGPGEFTYRAFMNGRIDLVQAESVLSLIESQSKQSSKMALRQLQGELSKQIEMLEDTLTWCLAHLEASIDFSAEDLEVVEHTVIVEKLQSVRTALDELLATYTTGRILKDGFRVALVGETNVGKSSLLNALTGQDRSIVTDIAGTTRDLVEGQIWLDGINVQLVDTAGVRESQDRVEQLGIERTKTAAREADFLLHVLDVTRPYQDLEWHQTDNRAIVLNKIDLLSEDAINDRRRELADRFGATQVLALSTRTGDGLRELKEMLRTRSKPASSEQSAVITQARHFELLEKTRGCVERARVLAGDAASPDFVAFELQDALVSIQEVLGKQFDDQVLDRVFKEFCIGK